MLQLVRNRQTDTFTWAASSTVAQDIRASGAVTRLVFRFALTPSATYASNHAIDALHRTIQTLNILGAGGVHYMSMGDMQIGRLLHRLNQIDGLVRGTGHGVLGTPVDIVWVVHFGSRPRDAYGRDNPFDLSAFMPAFDDTELRLEWGTTANDVTDAAITISSGTGYLTVYEVLGTRGEIKAEQARQGVGRSMIPVSSYKSYAHDGNYSDLSSEHDVPSGAYLRRIGLLSQDATATIPLYALDEIAQVGIKLPVGSQRIFQDDWRTMTFQQTPITSLNEADILVTTGVISTMGGVGVVDLREQADPDYGLDLRNYKVGDIKLGLTIENYLSGDDTFIWYDQVRPYNF